MRLSSDECGLGASEMKDQLQECAAELERRNAKILKYKRLLADERQKNDKLQSQLPQQPEVRLAYFLTQVFWRLWGVFGCR